MNGRSDKKCKGWGAGIINAAKSFPDKITSFISERFKAFFSSPAQPVAPQLIPADIALSPLLKERFASLLTRIQRLTQKRRLILQITSARSKEGRTTVAFLSGRTMASSDLGDFLLIDCDLYHPDLHTLVRADSFPGLLDLFQGTHDLAEVIKETNTPHLYFLPLGRLLPINQAQILISQKIGALLEQLRVNYDCILIDSPAINLSSLPEIIGAHTDGTILVVKANFTRREVVQAGIKLLQDAGIKISGVVLNQRKYVIPEIIYRRMK